MTPHAQPHPLRCGTCNYPHDMKDESGKWKRCPIAKCELSYERLSLIDVVGCNSHSSLRSRPAPASPDALETLLRPHIQLFALSMEWKLRKHDKDRGSRGWVGYVNEDEVNFLLRRLKQEVRELEGEIKKYPLKTRYAESWDVGNFAMMLDTSHFSDGEIAPKIREIIDILRQSRQGGDSR